MSSVGISVPGTLYLGAHPSTTAVSVGSNSSLVVTGSGVTLAGAISSGTSPLTCGAITASGAISCGTNPLTSGAITASGSFSCGGNAMTCGALSCASATSAGAVTQPQYYLAVSIPGSQAVSSGVITALSWTTQVTNSGFTFSNPTTTFTIPVAGTYAITYSVSIAPNATGLRSIWVAINGATVQTGMLTTAAVNGDFTRLSSEMQYQFAAGDTVSIQAWQTSGVSRNVGADGSNLTYATLNRLHE